MEAQCRRTVLAGSLCLIANSAVPAFAVEKGRKSIEIPEGTQKDVEQWMEIWMRGSTKNVDGALYLSRFVEPIYFLTQPIHWKPNPGQDGIFPDVIAPTGFVTDLASIPRPFFSLLRPDGEYTYAAIIHDWLYWSQSTSRENADNIFRAAMNDFGISKAVITTIYDAVRVGGAVAWTNNTKLKEKGERRVIKRFPGDPRTRWADWKLKPDVF